MRPVEGKTADLRAVTGDNVVIKWYCILRLKHRRFSLGRQVQVESQLSGKQTGIAQAFGDYSIEGVPFP